METFNPPKPAVNRTYLADYCYDVLRNAILDGTLTPGTPLREAEMAKRLGVSRTPVGEALRRLLLQGLVMKALNGTVQVSEMTPTLIAEAYELRKLHEGYAARQAAKHATPDDIAYLERLIVQAERAVSEGAVETLTALNDQFHGHIEAMAQNSLLTRITRDLQQHLPAFRMFALGRQDQQRGFVDEHRELLAALASHDSARAEALAIRHREHAQALLLDPASGTSHQAAPETE